ncbi:alpha/beta hydrolase [Embleya sp. MST-111070]|uniref:alpha/beta hydrolase n=1 Tax=Embleya sp. MST-111070 TaxID=3398231 RepID=UPI003F737DB6
MGTGRPFPSGGHGPRSRLLRTRRLSETAEGDDAPVAIPGPQTTGGEPVRVNRPAPRSSTGIRLLVGHSYGGVVITEAGNHEKVTTLVYIAAFAPDKSESVNTLIADPPPGAFVPPILPPVDGFLLLDRDRFAAAFAGDLPLAQTEFMADSQAPWGVDAAGGAVSRPAWRTKPSWYLVATDDHMIPPPAQHAMAERIGAHTVEVPGSHAVHVSRPAAVADLIKQAAAG